MIAGMWVEQTSDGFRVDDTAPVESMQIQLDGDFGSVDEDSQVSIEPRHSRSVNDDSIDKRSRGCNILICKWIKCFNAATQYATGTYTIWIYVVLVLNSPQIV